MTRALDLVADWPVPTAAAAVVVQGRVVDRVGPTDHRFQLASVGKTLVTWACLVAVEEGIISLEDAVGPDDGHHRTLRHLLSHASGCGFEATDPIGPPEQRRGYGNHAINVAADHLAHAAQMEVAEYLRLGVFEPLGIHDTALRGAPSHEIWSTADDLAAFIIETREPQLISAATAQEALRIQFPTLGGIVPGVGRFETCPWGLGFEIRGNKVPHWTGTANTATTYGHFGGSGTMFWRDPAADVGLVALTDRPFHTWATDALVRWPELSDAVLNEFAGTRA